jgi:hypothetical protein
MPSAKQLTGPGMAALRERLDAGATLYLSYFAGSTPTQRGPWLYGLQATFGVCHQLRYGLTDPIEDDVLELSFVMPFGAIAEGERLRFAVSGTSSARSLLPVELDGAEVVAVDAHGRPALLTHAVGAGTAVLCTCPLEYMAARTPRANPEPTWRLYDALADLAGVSRPLRCGDPRVSCVVAAGADGALASVTNLSDQTIEAAIADRGDERTMALGPYAAHTFTHT